MGGGRRSAPIPPGDVRLLDAGDPGAPPVLLLHGRGASGAMWEPFVPGLALDLRVLVPTLADPSEVEPVRGLLDRLGRPAPAVVAHGEGAAAGLLLGAEGRARVLVLLSAPVMGPELRAARDAVARRELPTLLVWGEEDDVVPVEAAEGLQDAIPTAALAVLPGCGHRVTEEAAPTVATLIAEFLRSRYLGRTHAHGPHGPVMLSLERRRPREEGA